MPRAFFKPEGAEIEWVWWGINCERRPNQSPASALLLDAAQLDIHRAALAARWRKLSTVSQRAKHHLRSSERRKAYSSLSEAGAEELAGTLIASALEASIPFAGFLASQAARRAVSMRKTRSDDRASSRARQIELTETHPPVDIASLVQDELPRFARAGIPIVIVIEDAHLADKSLIDMLEQLVRTEDFPLLVVMTTWPEGLVEDGPLKDFSNASDRVEVRRLGAIPVNELQLIVDALAPATEVELKRTVAEHFATPLLILEAFELQKYTANIRSGELILPVEEVLVTPRRLLDLYSRRWEELSRRVQIYLVAAASTQSQALGVCDPSDKRILLQPAGMIAEALGVVNPPTVLRDAMDLGWIAHSQDSGYTYFSEPLMNHAVVERFTEFDDFARMNHARSAVCEYARQVVSSPEREPLTNEATGLLVHRYVELVESGYSTTDDIAWKASCLGAKIDRTAFDYKSAIIMLKRALAWLPPTEGQEVKTGLMMDLGLALGEQGWVNEAIPIQERLLVEQGRLLGFAHPTALTIRLQLALNLSDAGRRNESAYHEVRTLIDSLLTLGPDHAFTLVVRNNLAGSLDPANAKHLTASVLADRLLVLGPDDPLSWASKENLSFYLLNSQESGEGLQLAIEVVEAYRRIYGSGHRKTRIAEQKVASARLEAGEPVDVFELMERLREDLFIESRGDRSLTAYRKARAKESRERWRAAYLALAEEKGAEHETTLACLSRLAGMCRTAGDVEAAIDAQTLLRGGYESKFGPTSSQVTAASKEIAELLCFAGQTTAAVERFRELIDRLDQSSDVDSETVEDVRDSLAEASRSAGMFTEAEQVCRTILKHRRQAYGEDDRRTLAARADLAIVLRESGQVVDAVAIVEQLLLDRTRVMGLRHPDTNSTRYQLGMWLLSTNRVTEAQAYMRSLIDNPIAQSESYDSLALRMAVRSTEILTAVKSEPDDSTDPLAGRVSALSAADLTLIQPKSSLEGRFRVATMLANRLQMEAAVCEIAGYLAVRNLISMGDTPDTENARARLKLRRMLVQLFLFAGRHEPADAQLTLLATETDSLVGKFVETGRRSDAADLLDDSMQFWSDLTGSDSDFVRGLQATAQWLRGAATQ